MKRGMTPTALSLARQSGHLPRFRADRQFFSSALTALSDFDMFSDVAMRGSWLYLSLNTAGLSVVSGESE